MTFRMHVMPSSYDLTSFLRNDVIGIGANFSKTNSS